jgi:hypothetical protein
MKSAFIALSLACLAACSSIPYGEVNGQRTKFSDPDVYDVIIVAVDGQMYMDGRTVMRLVPGFHLLQLASSKHDSRGNVAYQPYPLNVNACTRYKFVAKHERKFKIDDWQVVPDGEEKITPCSVTPGGDSARVH